MDGPALAYPGPGGTLGLGLSEDVYQYQSQPANLLLHSEQFGNLTETEEAEDPGTQRETLEDPSKAANTTALATETQETGDPAMEVRRARAQFLERICLERKGFF